MYIILVRHFLSSCLPPPPCVRKQRPYLETDRDRHPLLDPLLLPANARTSPPHLARRAPFAALASPRPPSAALPAIRRSLASPTERHLAR